MAESEGDSLPLPKLKRSKLKTQFSSFFGSNGELELGEFNMSNALSKLEKERLEALKFKRTRIIRQNSPWRVKWDLFVMTLAVWNSISIPMEIAFEPP
jgi:hypothetical protein